MSLKKTDNRKINKVGNLNGHQSGEIFSPDGLSRTLCCTDWKAPIKIVECRGSTQKHACRTDGSVCPTLTSAMDMGGGHIPMVTLKEEDDNYLKVNETTKKGYKEAYPSDGVLLNRIGRKIQKGIVRHGHSGSLTTDGSWGCVTNEYRIRRLTPVECERLQGFPDNWTKYGKDEQEISDTQRYKCLGNAVTTNVITYIIDNWEFR